MRDLIQILSRTPPRIDGVGDYAWRVGERLRAEHGISCRYLVCDPSQPAGPHDDFERRVLAEQSAQALVEALEAISRSEDAALLLHYVGYGFGRDGAPEWLVGGLERFLDRRRDASLATVFHELYATSKPWRKAFWFSRRQKQVAMRIRRMSTRALCTIERNRGELAAWSPDQPVHCMPVPSAIGEPRDSLPPWESRRRALVVFGLAHSRQRAYDNAAAIDAFCKRFAVEQILDIGPPLDVAPRFMHARWVGRGPLEPAQIAQTLLASRYGYLYYPVEYLAKSSIYAAHCAHGIATLLPGASQGTPDGLAADVHYASVAALPADDDALAGIARAATAWYQRHGIAAHAGWAAQLARDAIASAPP